MAEEQFQIYLFSKDEVDGDASQAALLGGKGANLAEMCKLGLPVPAGMTIPTDVCKMWQQCTKDEKDNLLDGLMEAVMQGIEWINDKQGKATLFSVRSGAPVSMPGMMDTILNVGICEATLPFWRQELGDRAALDTYRRLIQMLGSTAYGVPDAAFAGVLNKIKIAEGVEHDYQLDPTALKDVIDGYKQVFQAATQTAFPTAWQEHMRAAIAAVFDSWMNERAVTYRQMYGIAESMGTAVTVQAMVFGNRNDKSGSGVMFTRNPANGETGMYGEFLINAQGEDVVAGIRTPIKIAEMESTKAPLDGELWSVVYAELEEISEKLEAHYKDMMDIEFTVDNGALYMLQCRVGKRSGFAAIKTALDFMLAEKMIDVAEMFRRVTPQQYVIATRPSIPASFKEQEHGKGLPASPGVAKGIVAFTSQKAMAMAKEGKEVILVTPETNPDDIGGMHASQGFLTSTGGATCHAAVVARGMDKPCVVGLTDLIWQGNTAVINGRAFVEGDKITICGSSGRVWVQSEVPVADTSDSPYITEFRKQAMVKARGMEVASADWKVIDRPCYLPLDVLKAKPALFLAATEAGKKGINVIIDVDDPVNDLPDTTRELAMLFDTQDAKELVLNALVKMDKEAIANITLIGGLTDSQKASMSARGFKVGGIPKTVQDLFNMPMATIIDDFILTVFGSKDTYNEFVSMAEKSGKKMPQPLGKPMHPDFAVFTAISSSASN